MWRGVVRCAATSARAPQMTGVDCGLCGMGLEIYGSPIAACDWCGLSAHEACARANFEEDEHGDQFCSTCRGGAAAPTAVPAATVPLRADGTCQGGDEVHLPLAGGASPTWLLCGAAVGPTVLYCRRHAGAA